MATNEGKLDCGTCDSRLREERGHDKEGILYFWFEGKQVKRCPLMLITPLSWEYIKAFGFYEKGMLPNSGPWTQEGNKFIQAMMVLGNEFARLQNKAT